KKLKANSMQESKIGTFSALSIGIGGMVGGGIFAVTGLTVELTRGSAPMAFIIAGIVALLTAYSYWKLSLYLPNNGGTVYFINKAFGSGILTGSINNLLVLSYIILISIYAYAFGAYGARLFPAEWYPWLKHALLSFVLISLAVINYFSASLVIKSENSLNLIKMVLLAIFLVFGFFSPIDWHQMDTSNWVEPVAMVSGAFIIFLNYEGFELIANASNNIKNPKKALPIAFIGGVLIAIILYVLIVIVVVGHLSFTEIAKNSEHVLSEAAIQFMGKPGLIIISVAALLATSSAINATYYGSGRLTYSIAKSGELPAILEKSVRNQPVYGMIIFAVLSLFVANFIPLSAIATMGSAGFLLIFMVVNIANFKMYKVTQSSRIISFIAALACAIAFGALIYATMKDTSTQWEIFILLVMIAGSFLIEIAYRKYLKSTKK
ncbi:MAG: APC family permease, partial [Bacteroidota bacterium]